MSDSHHAGIPTEAFWSSPIITLGNHPVGVPSEEYQRTYVAFPKEMVLVLTDVVLYPASDFANPDHCVSLEIWQLVEDPGEKILKYKNQVTKEVGNWSSHFTTGLVFDARKAQSDRCIVSLFNGGLQAGIQLVGYFTRSGGLLDVIGDIVDGIGHIEVGPDILGYQPTSYNSNKMKRPSRRPASTR